MMLVCRCDHSEAEHDQDPRGWCLSFDTPNTLRCPCLRFRNRPIHKLFDRPGTLCGQASWLCKTTKDWNEVTCGNCLRSTFAP